METIWPSKEDKSVDYPEPIVFPRNLIDRQTLDILHDRGFNAQLFGQLFHFTKLADGGHLSNSPSLVPQLSSRQPPSTEGKVIMKSELSGVGGGQPFALEMSKWRHRRIHVGIVDPW